MFAAVADGSLDAGTRDEVRRLGLVGYAEAEVELYKSMPGERSWWRFAYDQAGDLVGFAMPSRNNGGPVVGFLGVLPAHRGHGYAADLLAEITADLADLGAERIVADTDATNMPMAATFDRLGYRRFGIRLVAGPAAAE
jgi:RimJ/RimL family protein N-acetyltransferase